MHIDTTTIQPLAALLFATLILIRPRLLNHLIAIYLIFVGLVGLTLHSRCVRDELMGAAPTGRLTRRC